MALGLAGASGATDTPPPTGSTAAPAPGLTWSKLPSLPDPLGVAGPFAGVSGGTLLVAGGANFPDKMPWEGGKKVWHGTVHALSATNAAWQVAGHLPQPLAYGVSVSFQGRVLCVGGSDADRHYAGAFFLGWEAGRLTVTPVAPLPLPLANAAGAVVGETVFVAGGSEAPGEQAATRRCFAFERAGAEWRWRELEPLPGAARILPTAAVVEGAFHLLGGAALEAVDGQVKRVPLREVWRYRPGQGWDRRPDLPKPAVACPSPAPVNGPRLFLVGGDDGSRVGGLPATHPGFPTAIVSYDAHRGTSEWRGETPASRATAPVVEWAGRWVIPSGEVRPGVRSPEVWTLRFNP